MVQSFFRFLSGAISIYMLLIFIRILLTWFPGNVSNFARIIARFTDPYLNLFRRLRIFRSGRFDFSPVLALITLGILSSITGSIAMRGSITFGIVIAIIIRAIWSMASFFLMFLLILIVIRSIGFLAGGSSISPFWMALDQTLQPIVHRLTYRLFRSPAVSYFRSLLATAGILLAVWLIGGWLIGEAIVLFASLPV